MALELDQLDAECHHEQVLFGVVEVAEIEGVAKGSVVQRLEHLAETKVVVDIERDEVQ